MKRTRLTLAAGTCLLAWTIGGQAFAQNPLDRFRSDNQNQQQQQPQQVQQRQVNPPSNGGVPSPTVGGFQQQGLSQDEVNQALDSYNFGNMMSAEEQQARQEAAAREAAYEAALNGSLPLRPDEIRRFIELYGDVREARQTRIGGTPEPEIAFETVSLDPSSTPPVLKLSAGHVTTLNIVDISGKPWPIKDISWGGNFEVIQPEAGEHVVRISPMQAHEVGNLSIQLLELDTPVTFALHTQLDEVQFRFDAQIPEYGPNAEMPLVDGGLNITTKAGSNDIVKILDGTPPSSATKLNISGVDGRTTAYDLGGQIYVRTPLTLLSPGWSNSITSADGTKVYVIGQSPVLLLSDKGKMARAMIDYN